MQDADVLGDGTPPERKEGRVPTEVEVASRRIWLNLLELPWDEGRLVVRGEMRRLGLAQEDLAYKLRRNGYRTSLRSVKAWLNAETEPRYDAIREIVLVLANVDAGDSPKASLRSQPQLPYDFGSGIERRHVRESAPPSSPRQVPRPRILVDVA